ncbi:DUF6300 family protein [Streptomyces swartbergensis]|uniref:DUF6300 family protein n=1 Tax=Streptomyces swartbergensis TaxID=487165 RepID=UPI003CC6253F
MAIAGPRRRRAGRCSRCGGDLLLQWNGPWGTGVWMGLCPACDAERPAARALIDWHRDPDRDPEVLPSCSRTGRPPVWHPLPARTRLRSLPHAPGQPEDDQPTRRP